MSAGSSQFDDSNVSEGSSENLDDELSSGLLNILLERELKRIVRSADGDSFLQSQRIKVSHRLPPGDKMRAVMIKVFDMDTSKKVDLFKETKFAQVRMFRERLTWHTYRMSGSEPVHSPRGRRKIALRVQDVLHRSVVAMCETFDEAVWVAVFDRKNLQKLADGRRIAAVTPTVFVWYQGEDALYVNRAGCAAPVVSAVCTTLGFCKARQIRLSGRRLSSMRLMFTAREDRRFNDRSLPANEYPLPF